MTHNATLGFQPSAALIAAAEAVLVSMAMEQGVAPAVEAYEAEILARHQFPPDPKWRDMVKHDVILNRKIVYLLAEADREVFYAECRAARDAAGFKTAHPDGCPLLEAHGLRIDAETAFIRRLGELPGMEILAERADAMSLDMRKKAVDLGLRMLAPFVGSAEDILKRISTS